MRIYTLTLDCESCGEEMKARVADITAGPDDELVINLDMAVSQTDFECICGARTYLGDLEDICLHELGVEPDEEED